MKLHHNNLNDHSAGRRRFHHFRKGATAVEAAVVMPLLMLLFVASVDFARVFQHMQVIAECARVGAVYAADPDLAARTEFETPEAITLAAAGKLSPTPTVVVAYGTDSRGDKYAEVTVNYSFKMITSLLGSQPLTLSRKSRARLRASALEE